MQAGFDPLFPRGQLQAYWKSQYLDELPDDAIDLIAAKAARPAGAADARQHVPHGRRDRRTSTPRPPRSPSASSPFMVSIDGMWTDASRQRRDDRVGSRSLGEIVKQFGNGSVYLNFTGLADEAPSAGVDTRVRAAT